MKRLLIACLVLPIVLSACSRPQQTATDDWLAGLDFQGIRHVTILAGPSAGTHELVSAGVSDVLGRAIPSVQFTAIPTGGNVANVELLNRGEGEVGVATGDGAAEALRGTPPYTERHEGLRAMFAYFPNTIQLWVRGDSGITEFNNLRRNRFSFGIPANATFHSSVALMEMFGFTEAEKGNQVLLPWAETVSALQDNNIQAVVWCTTAPIAAIVDAQMRTDIRLIEIDNSVLQRFKADRDGWLDVIIPAGTYRDQTQDVRSIGTPNFFAVWETLPSDLVYAMTRALWENREHLSHVHALMSTINEQNVARISGAQLHPGAQRYWNEMGIPTN